MSLKISNTDSRFCTLAAKLDVLSPLKIMSRGYLLAENESGSVLKSIEDVNIGQDIYIRMCDGKAKCTVNSLARNEDKNNEK